MKSRSFLPGYRPQKFLHISVGGGDDLHYSVAKGADIADSHGYTRQLLMKVGFWAFISLVCVLAHVSSNARVLLIIARFCGLF